ncbi:MAG: secretin N-terminal domain-containing protein [Phycisphaerales bacterium]
MIGIATALIASSALGVPRQDPTQEPPAQDPRPAPTPPPPATESRPAPKSPATPQDETRPQSAPTNAPKTTGTSTNEKPAASGADGKSAATNGAKAHANDGGADHDQNADLTKPPGVSRESAEGKVKLSFKNEKVEGFIPYIQEWTGKAVLVKSTAISAAQITLVHDKEVSKHKALDLVFTAFRINDIAVVETPDLIILGQQTDSKKYAPGVILPPDQSPLDLQEEGVYVTKVFRIKNAKANDVYERLQESVPENATLSVDPNSNQIVLEGDIGLAKKIQLLINNLDVPVYLPVRTETFRIRYQDASLIADNIRELFEGSGSVGGGRSTAGRPQAGGAQRGGRQPQPGQPQGGLPTVGTSEALVVTVLPALNLITVRAEPQIVDEIRTLISQSWDLPPNADGSPFRTYELRYTDPIKVRDTLQALLEGGGGQTRAGSRAAAGGRVPFQGGGSDSGAGAAVSNVFRFEAFPDSRRLVVISKTPDNFVWLDKIVDALDQQLNVGLPRNVPLKYASAFDLADILNVLLSESGVGGIQLQRPSDQLSGINFETAGGGGASGTSGSTGDASRTGGTTGAAGASNTSLPWQTSNRGAGASEQSEPSAIIGKMRVVPNATQNSLLILAPPEIEDAVLKIIEDLDRPGRQVMITAVLAEVSLGDGFSWGLRVGSNLAAPLNGGDNSVGGTASLDLAKGNGQGGGGNNFASPWFDVSLLTVGTEVSFLLQALKETNNVRILQEPRVFTSDNAEAIFFAGQDISLQTGSTTGSGTGGGTTTSFEQQAVGIGLNVRPRITRDRNVYLDINLLLSNVSPTGQQYNSNPVIDRRQTTTKVTVKNGQTVVLSGIRREDETNIKRAIPLLGEIPGLDAIFASTEKQKTVAELVVFVTPIVVENPEENDTNFNVLERKRLDQLSTPLDSIDQSGAGRFFYDRNRLLQDSTRPSATPAPGAPSGPNSTAPSTAPSQPAPASTSPASTAPASSPPASTPPASPSGK